jgi:glutamate synthase domain-containing protein 1/glutamate synthase domain-containing protein 3
MTDTSAESILSSRRRLPNPYKAGLWAQRSPEAAEGGCGVLGFASNVPVAGRHVLTASQQMHNRGNGKGGGIAMVGLEPTQARVDFPTLQSHYLLQIALLDPSAREEVEREYFLPHFDIAQAYPLPHLDDHREISGLEVRPPDVWRYFCRVKPRVLEHFAREHALADLPERAVEDEFIYQNTYRLNLQFYASLGEKRAFVLSHGRNLSVLKIVGYAESVVQYYCLENASAHVWIAHQRYPTKGRIWHPGGAHPFIGLNEALVHNGDFANYHAVSEYLRQRNISQLFLTDTEVSVQLFDLWDRVYSYPLEITLEAMAPTTEFDFAMLPPDKKQLYHAVQRAHMHGSPDGPWFFILARSFPDQDCFELLGITDTSMLRPQVFALYENHLEKPLLSDANGLVKETSTIQIGLIASERQAINACLRSLAAEDERFQPYADRYWVARGGSHTDGGAFRFTVRLPESGIAQLTCVDKFDKPVTVQGERVHLRHHELDPSNASSDFRNGFQERMLHAYDDGGAPSLFKWMRTRIPEWHWDEVSWALDNISRFGHNGEGEWRFSLESLNMLRDRRFGTGNKKRASLLSLLDAGFDRLFGFAPILSSDPHSPLNSVRRVTWESRLRLEKVNPPGNGSGTLVIDARGFPAEGPDSAARAIAHAAQNGWSKIIVYRFQGGRFAASGLGPSTDQLQIDLYGDVGDYTASGLDGAEVHLHGDAQDQVGQILRRGKLAIYGDVGQTFLYGAKGGDIYVLGSAAGRPLINAVGRPHVVINGTCLDYLAESFMAGDPHDGGGFVILNGVAYNEDGSLIELASPYPGGNLFSLASGGAIFVRDPRQMLLSDQLNGGDFTSLSDKDWKLIQPYLLENERLFGITLNELLTVDGQRLPPDQVYRKVAVHTSQVLMS